VRTFDARRMVESGGGMLALLRAAPCACMHETVVVARHGSTPKKGREGPERHTRAAERAAHPPWMEGGGWPHGRPQSIARPRLRGPFKRSGSVLCLGDQMQSVQADDSTSTTPQLRRMLRAFPFRTFDEIAELRLAVEIYCPNCYRTVGPIDRHPTARTRSRLSISIRPVRRAASSAAVVQEPYRGEESGSPPPRHGPRPSSDRPVGNRGPLRLVRASPPPEARCSRRSS
jgi:hypothetical protein